MKIIKIIFDVFYWLIILSLFVIAGVTALSVFKIPGGRRLFVVQSGSMEPSIKTGSIVLTQKQDTYYRGDVVTFFNGSGISGETTTHRIIETEVNNGEEFFTTKGDANEGSDREKIGVDNIIGRTILEIPHIGFVIAFAKTQMGFTFLIVVPAVIIIFSEILNIKKQIIGLIEKKKEKTAVAQ